MTESAKLTVGDFLEAAIKLGFQMEDPTTTSTCTQYMGRRETSPREAAIFTEPFVGEFFLISVSYGLVTVQKYTDHLNVRLSATQVLEKMSEAAYEAHEYLEVM